MTESLNPLTGTANGITELNARRARRTRQAPQPRHPKPATDDASALADQPTSVTDTGAPPQQPARFQGDREQPAATAAASASGSTSRGSDEHGDATANGAPSATETVDPPGDYASHVGQRPGGEAAGPTVLPTFDVDPADPTAHIVSPTVLSIPESIQYRFKLARTQAPSHTALVLDALRAHAQDLPTLILNRRPGLKPGDLFPFREAPGHSATDTPLPLRIRPTRGELAVMKKLADWASGRMAELRVGAPQTNRSEMVAAALDAFLPPAPKRRPK